MQDIRNECFPTRARAIDEASEEGKHLKEEDRSTSLVIPAQKPVTSPNRKRKAFDGGAQGAVKHK